MESKLMNFLLQFQVEKGSDFTHTSIIKPSGSFFIPIDNLDKFYDIYGDAFNKQSDIYLTEKPRDTIPILIDLDFRFSKDDPSRKYTLSTIQDIVKLYIKHIKNVIVTPDNFNIYVMEKPFPVINKDILKDGIHIVIPDIVTKSSVQLHIRQEVLKEINEILSNLQLTNSSSDVVDEAVITTNNWQMYGSKKPNCEPYLITHIFDQNMNEQIIESDHSKYVSILSLRNKYIESEIKFDKQLIIKSINDDILRRKKEKMLKNTSIFQNSQNTKTNIYDDLTYIKKLIHVLKVERANNYSLWIRLGWCLRNIDNRLLDDWIEFSQQSNKFVSGECERIWDYMKDDGLGIGSLHLWAKEDNPELYKEIINTDCNKLMDKASSETHTDIAAVIYNIYKYDYVCVSIKNNLWYEFKNHRWTLCDSAHTLRTIVSSNMSKTFAGRSAFWANKASVAEDECEQNRCSDKAKKLITISQKLKMGPFKENIIKECRDMFYQSKFEDKLDSRFHLIGFENGVYDLESKEFREGRPEDYIMFTTGINYVPYNPTSNSAIELDEFLSKVLTNPVMKEYIISLFASFLNGNKRQERFHIWTGIGANGKSCIIDLFERAFGEYCCKLPITLLTQKRAAANAATSELARTKGKRFACLQEPSEDEKLNVGLMKELSGGDKIQARSLFKEPIEFKPQFKMILTCNHLPAVPSDDGGTWRRIRVAEFTSRFCEDPDPTKPTEFAIDSTISDKFDSWREQFMALLIDKYVNYVQEFGVKEPEEVMTCTMDYQKANDTYADFIASEFEPNEMMHLTMADFLQYFKIYLKDNNILPTPNILKKTNIIKSMEKASYGKYVRLTNNGGTANNNEGWKGVTFKSGGQSVKVDDILDE
jgi:P4 family phage/plasmid primase-like protien